MHIKNGQSTFLYETFKAMIDLATLIIIGTVLIIAGLIISYVMLRFNRHTKENRSEERGGAIIMIGPIPIIFGTDKKAIKEVIVLALIFSVIMFVVFVVYYRFLR